MSDIVHLNDSNYETETAQGVVVVDFWAPWCGPCRALAPHLEAAAQKFDGKLRIAKYNVDEAGKLRIAKYNVDEANEYASKLGIRSIPTLIVYEDGKPIQQHVGSMGQSQLEDFLNQFV